MKFKPSNILISILFAALLIGTGYTVTKLKEQPQLFVLLFGILTLFFLVVKKPFRSPLPFYILLGAAIYFSIFNLSNFLINEFNLSHGWVLDENGERQGLMSTSWVVGVLIGIVLAPLSIILYHYKIRRNKVLEVSFTLVFIVLTAVI